MKPKDIASLPKKRGKRELVEYWNGKKISFKAAINAKCYECMGYCADGGLDCLIPDCPLYLYSPYRKAKIVQDEIKPRFRPKGNPAALLKFQRSNLSGKKTKPSGGTPA